jgi:NagD protein
MGADVVCGIEAGLHTIPVLPGVMQKKRIGRFQFRPSRLVSSIADLV